MCGACGSGAVTAPWDAILAGTTAVPGDGAARASHGLRGCPIELSVRGAQPAIWHLCQNSVSAPPHRLRATAPYNGLQ